MARLEKAIKKQAVSDPIKLKLLRVFGVWLMGFLYFIVMLIKHASTVGALTKLVVDDEINRLKTKRVGKISDPFLEQNGFIYYSAPGGT